VITSEGQVTLPKEVRERLGLQTGDQLLFTFEGDDLRVLPLRRKSIREMKGVLKTELPYCGKETEREAAKEAFARKLNLTSSKPKCTRT